MLCGLEAPMGAPTPHAARALARQQHNNIMRRQLLELGYSVEAIRHRLAKGRLHEVFRGVYAVDRPHEMSEGMWMAAVLRCGEGAALSHASSAALWEVRPRLRGLIEVTIPAHRTVEEPGIRVYRSRTLEPGGACGWREVPQALPAYKSGGRSSARWRVTARVGAATRG